jgi:hypothetical protein
MVNLILKKNSSGKKRPFSMEKEDDFEAMLLNENDAFELSNELMELRRKYMEMKKERQKSQKDAHLLENKIKLLSNEENKVNKKNMLHKQSQEEMDTIRRDVMSEKLSNERAKADKMNEIREKQNQIVLMKEKIRSAVTESRINVRNKNNNEFLKIKDQSKLNSKLIEINKFEIEEKKKQQANEIKVKKLTTEEKKKKSEMEKKIKMMLELEAKILEEQKQKDTYQVKRNLTLG